MCRFVFGNQQRQNHLHRVLTALQFRKLQLEVQDLQEPDAVEGFGVPDQESDEDRAGDQSSRRSVNPLLPFNPPEHDRGGIGYSA
jgi:hypothetical protein